MKKRIAYSVERIAKKEMQTNYFYPLNAKRYTLNKAFTLIEMIIAIAVIAIIMIPVALMLMEYVRSMAYADSLTVAANLAQREMGVINSMDYAALNSAVFTKYAGYNFDLDRAVAYVPGSSNNGKTARIRVFPYPIRYPIGSFAQLIDLSTYAIGMNVGFGAGSGGGAQGEEAASLQVWGGNLANGALNNVTMRNTRPNGNITVTGVIMTATLEKTLRSIEVGNNSDNRINISAPISITSSPTTVSFDRIFFMHSSTTYTDTKAADFNFADSPNRTYSLSIIFLFSDGSQSATYVWTHIA